MSAWNDYAEALAGEGTEPLFAALCKLVQEEIGARLFTVMTFDPQTRMASRTSSSRMPQAFSTQSAFLTAC